MHRTGVSIAESKSCLSNVRTATCGAASPSLVFAAEAGVTTARGKQDRPALKIEDNPGS